MSVQVKLPFIKKTERFLTSGHDKVLAQIAADTIDEITENFSKAKSGAGNGMPKLDNKYQTRKISAK